MSRMKTLLRKLKGRLRRPTEVPPDSDRDVATLPEGGTKVSVEKALNSRCTSDYDDDQDISHWGMFDKTKKLTADHIKAIVGHAKTCRLSNHRMEIRKHENELTLVIDNRVSGIQRDWLMVENGMQQQAIALVCAALGVGMVLHNQGTDGNEISTVDLVTIKIKLDAMKPSYAGSYWSASEPVSERAWKPGNMPSPARDGAVTLLEALTALISPEHLSKGELTEEKVGQLFWAARGRTPHLYKSKPWGMTIPTWAGNQNLTSIYLLIRARLLQYVNWQKGRAAHFLREFQTVVDSAYAGLATQFFPWNCFIVLAVNDPLARGLWEIGYQLLNILLQAKALHIGCHAVLLDARQKENLYRIEINNPVAIVGLAYEQRMFQNDYYFPPCE
jgi:hypothetical protein